VRKFTRAACLSISLLSRIGRVMLIVHVHVHVKPECVEAFKRPTLANALESLKEPGVARFDVIQQQDDPTRFVLVEVYRDAAAAAAHKETKHYPVWRDAVAPMMAAPRSSVKFNDIFPDDAHWQRNRDCQSEEGRVITNAAAKQT
jgi:(4S)-4-hydroxy-5-phosphonooxypentane-2,3-dione isomerase